MEYKIKEMETYLPEMFPSHYWVLVQAIEKSTNLIRLFVSRKEVVNLKHSPERQELDKEIFADKFAFRIGNRQEYEIIDYNETLKFDKAKNGRLYSRYLINNNGVRVRDI